MRKPITALAAGLLAVACAGTPEPEPGLSIPDPGLDLGDPELTLGAPVQVDNLTVWPVLRSGGAPRAELASYVPLDDALRAGDARVLEKGDVNELVIVNDGTRPVLCLTGEVLEGGQQDRIVARDVVIEPGQTANLASFCVEQGRWHTEAGDALDGKAFRSAELFVAGNVKAAAQVSAAQDAVWANVALAQHANSVQSDTGAYLALRDSVEVSERVAERAGVILKALEGRGDAVGIVAAFDLGEEDEHVTGEVFGDAALCAAYREKLVHAYALDSISRGAKDFGVDQRGLSDAPMGGIVDVADVTNGLEDMAERGLQELGPAFFLDEASGQVVDFRGLGTIAAPAAGFGDVVLTDTVIEAANADLRHVHRTLYKRRASEDTAGSGE